MIRSLRFAFAVLLCGASLSHAALGASPATSSEPVAGSTAAIDSQEDTLYAQGSKAMDEQRWNDAVTAFDQLAAAKGKRADAGLYWKAYSLNKLGRKEEAGAVCGQLRGQYESSTWNKECRVLQARQAYDDDRITRVISVNTNHDKAELANLHVNLGDLQSWSSFPEFRMGGKARPATDDDIKILALNSLMRQDPAKALPLLRTLVHSDKPVTVRKQALFVLSRSKDPQAVAILTELATGKSEPDLQREAIQILALNRGKEAGPMLVEIYRNSTDAGVKRAALSGLYMAHDAQRLVELARNEKDLNQKRDIVEQLATMKDQAATDYMLELLK
jgi:hypothetical protein